MREHLLGYLMGALDDAERLEVERRLEHDPRLREEFDVLAASLEPLEAARENFEPPPGLAASACRLVQAYAQPNPVEPARRTRAMSEPNFRNASAAAKRWTLADLVVAGGVCLAGALLFMPAIATSQFNANRLQCENNLRELGLALVGYSQNNDHRFPQVPTAGKRAAAGIFAPVLLEERYLEDSNLLVCPASNLAEHRSQWRVPSLEEIDAAEGLQLVKLQRQMGGSYAFNLGFIEDGRLRAARNQGRTYYAIMSDAPAGAWNANADRRGSSSVPSLNHGGRGLNLLYEDGHVVYMIDCSGENCADDPFANRFGRVEAGIDGNDAVLGPSGTPPIQNLKFFQ